MNYITAFDIRLSKDIYYSGEILLGTVILANSQNIPIKDIYVILRGKAHTHIKLNRTGESHTLHDKQYILNEKLVIWDKKNCDENEDEPILFSGLHNFPFQFQLPQSSMPCSLETKLGTIRYYVKVIINIPHGTIPQGIKYFTIIGPSINCMDEKYCCALLGQNKKITWHGCCRRGALALRVIMDRTAYLCGENVRILAHVENRQNGIVWIAMRLIQVYFIIHMTLPVQPYTQGKFDTAQLQSFIIPVVPPTLIGACIEDEKGNQMLPMEFPLTIATLPFLKATMPTPMLDYDICCAHVEGGRYISPEFRIDHTDHVDDDKDDLDEKSISMASGDISQLTIPETEPHLEKEENSDDNKNSF
ncbi:Arrestin domain protein [Dirofilaria immitis]|nr:Arrestin domain protein [Dirofilaria immitis]